MLATHTVGLRGVGAGNGGGGGGGGGGGTVGIGGIGVGGNKVELPSCYANLGNF